MSDSGLYLYFSSGNLINYLIRIDFDCFGVANRTSQRAYRIYVDYRMPENEILPDLKLQNKGLWPCSPYSPWVSVLLLARPEQGVRGNNAKIHTPHAITMYLWFRRYP